MSNEEFQNTEAFKELLGAIEKQYGPIESYSVCHNFEDDLERLAQIKEEGEEGEARQWALTQLDDIAKLGQNWDSYGADPISPVAIATASKLLQMAEEKLGAITYERLQAVAPRPDGGVQIEWGTRPIEISVHADYSGNLGYLYIDHQSDTTKYKEVSNASRDKVLSLISEVLRINEETTSC